MNKTNGRKLGITDYIQDARRKREENRAKGRVTSGETGIYSQPSWDDPTVPRNIANQNSGDGDIWAVEMQVSQLKEKILDKIIEYKLSEMFAEISKEKIEMMKKALRKREFSEKASQGSEESSLEDPELAELVDVAYSTFYKRLASKSLRELEKIWEQINPRQQENIGKEPGK